MKKTLILFFVVSLGFKCSTNKNNISMSQEEPKFTNALAQESSPYLLQHAHNPVNWMPWGVEALAQAKKENKPLLISIGYAACHWCHVMEHESFEDTAVANVMNEKFICIKIDREERPDIDQIYMDACQLIQKSGGWPLNAFALPDGRPFYAGTYYPKDNWVDLLNQLSKYYQEKPDDAELRASQITAGLNSMESIVPVTKEESFYTGLDEKIWRNWETTVDYRWGGRGQSPKFPMPVGWEYVLQYYKHSGNEKALKAVTVTLDKMAYGGIYDQVGGGFSRYSVDAKWKAPHFEKMLYDNGQLISLYSNAYKVTKNPEYKRIVEETIEFVERELMHKEGGFYSSLDADSEGEEGKFYVWTQEEFLETVAKAGSKSPDLLAQYYNLEKNGNWEGHNILWLKNHSKEEFVKDNQLNEQEWNKELAMANDALLQKRAERVRPGLDDKILVSWNALMIKGLCDAYQALGQEKYLNMAINSISFIEKNLLVDSTLNRNYKYTNGKGKASITGFLDDYALLIEAYISLYQLTMNEEYLLDAKKLTLYVFDNFYDAKSGMFFYTPSNGEKLIARKMEISDNVIPASNSVMAKNLFILGDYFELSNWKQTAKQMLHNTSENLVSHGPYYSNWAQLMNMETKPIYEVAIVGDNYKEILKKMQQNYLPNVLYLGGKTEGKLPLLEFKLQKGETIIYVCSGGVCKQPVTSVEEVLKMLE